MVVLQTPNFKNKVNKLTKLQKRDLDSAIKSLVKSPDQAERNKGGLAFLRVYKFKMNKQEQLLGYSFDGDRLALELLALGAHENFYRDLKR
ncbi:MAG: type II toxin-antitoxin system RelE/ParE family toxin [Immundisolibacteraceae bacterium]|nr:type II toxin-antitoxin system RelE/ParE family toxin [Immundisolibacteraceae bacterium]